jgi:hypothetical protein
MLLANDLAQRARSKALGKRLVRSGRHFERAAIA